MENQLLKDIDKKSPYFYKLSKTQQQISNLINDYDNHVEDIRGNYLEICKTKMSIDKKHNFKILQYPNYTNKIILNLLKEKKMPFGKHKGELIDDLSEEYIEIFIKSKLYSTNKRVRKSLQNSIHKKLIRKLNRERIRSKKKSNKSNKSNKSKKSGGRTRDKKKKKTKRRKKRQSKHLGKSPYKLTKPINILNKPINILNNNNLNNNNNFKKTIYYFYADYCGHCKRFNPLFNKLKHKFHKKINFKKIDGKKPENQSLLTNYNIKSFPTLIIKENKKQFINERNEKNLIDFIKSSV